MATTRVTDLQALTTPDGADVLHAVDVSADRDSKLTITGLQAAIGAAFAPVAHQHSTSEIPNFNASTRAQIEDALTAGANITLTPSGVGANRRVTIAAAGGTGGVSAVTGTAPIQVANGTTAPAVSITAATTSAAGSMSGADKTKLDGVAAGATVNSTDAQLRDRATHTGTQLAATISDFTAGSRAQVEAALTAGANITLTPSGSGATRTIAISAAAGGGGATNLDGLSDVTLTSPATDQVLKFNGTAWVNAAAPGGGGGTVTLVTGGAGLTGSINTSGALAVGAGTGITVNADDVAINRTVVDGWYATAAQGALAASAVQSVAGTAPITVSGAGSAKTVAIDPASGSAAGSMSSANFTKLAGIANGATANATDAQLRDRATHTGTQAGSTITGLYTASGMTMSGVGLLGRAAAGGGPAVEISIGTGLQLTGTTLTATASGGGGATDLDGLSDVSILSPANGQILGFNAGFWRNLTPSNLFLAQSNPTGVTGADAITNMISLTQAEYDAIVTKNASTLYVIT